MDKECLQIISTAGPTPCFMKAGSIPCETPGCPVQDRIEELRQDKVRIDGWWSEMLLHSRCRISSLSKDNQEFKERIRES